MKATYKKYILRFKQPSGTSRGILTEKESWFLVLEDDGRKGIGECGLLRGLSSDDVPGYEQRLKLLCTQLQEGDEISLQELAPFPSIQFGLEQALGSLASQEPFILFPSDFTKGKANIPINGLVWMGNRDFMLKQVREKVEAGFSCIKLKIGALDFDTELAMLRKIRREHPAEFLELRVDANGAFDPSEAIEKLNRLSELELHSIEQPVMPGQIDTMAYLCASSPLPIALDEELIGIHSVTDKQILLQTIQPDYLILKPSLMGGMQGCDEWMSLASSFGTKWWVTSALESNIGLNAIAQYTFLKKPEIPQGLGTGGLFTNNFSSPLQVCGGSLSYNRNTAWTDKTF